MITDKQGREWLLQKLYDDDWRYLVMDKYETLYLTNEKPTMFSDTDDVMISSCESAICITAIKTIFLELKQNEHISIAEELGIVDWSKVEVDTPIFVRNSIEEVWKCRYFAMYENGAVYAWQLGRTSWSNVIKNSPIAWKYAKLAGDTHE